MPFLNQFTSRSFRLIVLTFLLIGLDSTLYCQETKPQRYALLVGVTSYSHASLNKPQLVYPEIDALEFGQFLEKHGNVVDYLLESKATQSAIQLKLDGLSKKGNQPGVAIVGFWGHGVLRISTK